jgi:rod shape determining protein RodA
MPVTGIPLPFVSFGGSSAIANFIAIGIVISINIYKDEMTIAS